MTQDPTTIEKRDGAGNVTLSVGPLDVDRAAEVTAKLGVHNKAKTLLARHARMYPRALRQALSRPVDGDRSNFVRDNAELRAAVESAARSVTGRGAFLADEDEFESVDVRGDENIGRVFGIIYRKPSGRSARGVINYGAVPAVERQFQAQARPDPQTAANAPEAGADGGVTDAEIEGKLEEIRQEFEAKLTEQSAALKAAEERAAALENPEPFEGYNDTNAADLAKRIKEGGVAEFGEAGLNRIREYETSGKRRSTVVDAVEEAIDAGLPGERPSDGE